MRKPSVYVRHYAFELECEKELTDQEARLYALYKLTAGWDKKQKDSFGVSIMSIRQIQEGFLPDWSIGKISSVRASLVRKGWIEKVEKTDSGIRVKMYEAYRIKTQWAEQCFRQIKQGVQVTEQSVRNIEQTLDQKKKFFRKTRKEILDISASSVQPDEQVPF